MSVETRLNEIVAAHFNVPVESIRPGVGFRSDLAADALDMPELAMDVEEAFDIMLEDRIVDGMDTVRDLLDYVRGSLEEKRLFSASASAAAVYLYGAKARGGLTASRMAVAAAYHGGSRE